MQKYKKYLWLIPALYVSYMFGNKIVEGLNFSEEFQQIISVIPFLKSWAYYLTPAIGIFDFIIAVSLILNPFTFKNNNLQKLLFTWTILWPFIPASLRYFGGIGDFEIVEVLSISVASIVSYILWKNYK